MLRAFLMVGIGGFAGSIARYGLSLLVSKNTNNHFPWGTFIVNISGCLLIGILYGLAVKNNWLHGTLWLLLASGFCGGYTTFSAFALENINLLGKQQSWIALLYILLSIVLGLLACKAAIALINPAN